jgi:hypothetical protein
LKRHKGINAFIVEKGWADIGPKKRKWEWSDTHSTFQ